MWGALSHRHAQPPTWPLTLDREHPLAENLLFVAPLTDGAHAARDLISSTPLERYNTPRAMFRQVPGMGTALDVYNNTGAVRDLNFALPDAAGICVAFWALVPTTPSGAPQAFQIGGSGASDRILAHCPFSDGTIYWDYGNATGGSGRVSTSFAGRYGTPQHIVLWAEGSSSTGEGQGIQANGKVLTSAAQTATPTTLTDLWIGIGSAGTSTSCADAYIADFRVYHGPQTAEFRHALWEPSTRWGIYHQTNRRSYFIPAPAVGGSTQPPRSMHQFRLRRAA